MIRAARWSVAERESAKSAADEELPIVYADNVFECLFDAFETLAVVASESMQPQTMSELVRGLTLLFERLGPAQQNRVEDLIRRSLSALGEHVLTHELDCAIASFVTVLESANRRETAAQLETARQALGHSIGKLGSRATRVTSDA